MTSEEIKKRQMASSSQSSYTPVASDEAAWEIAYQLAVFNEREHARDIGAKPSIPADYGFQSIQTGGKQE